MLRAGILTVLSTAQRPAAPRPGPARPRAEAFRETQHNRCSRVSALRVAPCAALGPLGLPCMLAYRAQGLLLCLVRVNP